MTGNVEPLFINELSFLSDRKMSTLKSVGLSFKSRLSLFILPFAPFLLLFLLLFDVLSAISSSRITMVFFSSNDSTYLNMLYLLCPTAREIESFIV